MDYQPHKTLETEVKEFLEQHNFYVDELTYHSRFPREIADLLARRYSPTALYLRGRADRIAIHRTLPIEFEWEAKTHQSRRYSDMALEGVPVAHHLSKARFDVKCLYVYRNPFVNHDCGFWIEQLPVPKVAMIPDRWGAELKDWFCKVFSISFPGVKIAYPPFVNGTGDPYVIIDRLEVDKMQDWRQKILDLL